MTACTRSAGFKPDRIPALRRESEHKVTNLTKKLFAAGDCWKGENQFSPKECYCIHQPQYRTRDRWTTHTQKKKPCFFWVEFFFCLIDIQLFGFSLSVWIVFLSLFYWTEVECVSRIRAEVREWTEVGCYNFLDIHHLPELNQHQIINLTALYYPLK